jgi:hypothetical protein
MATSQRAGAYETLDRSAQLASAASSVLRPKPTSALATAGQPRQSRHPPGGDRQGSRGTVALRPSQVSVGGASLPAAASNPAASVLGVVGRGAGRPLPAGVRADAEAAFGADFSRVRIHTDDKAAESAASVSARAYTLGNEIVLGAGSSFSPDTAEGRHDLAHELTHVIQQRNGPVAGTSIGGGVALSHPSDAFERQAEATAHQFVSGRMHPAAGLRQAPASRSAPSAPVVQRVGEGVLPGWLVQAGEATETVVKGAGTAISAGAIAVGAAVAAAILTWSSPADLSPGEEQVLLSRDRAIAALRAIAQQFQAIGAIALASMAVAEIERLRGRVQGAVDAINDLIRKDIRQLNKCANELAAFKAAAQALLDALSQPPDKIVRLQTLGLLAAFQKAMQDLLMCMGVAPGPGPGAA